MKKPNTEAKPIFDIALAEWVKGNMDGGNSCLIHPYQQREGIIDEAMKNDSPALKFLRSILDKASNQPK